MATLYLGEANGARIIRNGLGLAQVGDAYDAQLGTWDMLPGGEVGDVSFRSIDATLKVTNGYAVGITPTIDGVDLPEQQFSGVGAGEVQCQAFIGARGSRISARMRLLALTGDVDVHDVGAEFVVIRRAP